MPPFDPPFDPPQLRQLPELFELDVLVPPPKLLELELVEELEDELLEELELLDELVDTPLEVEVDPPELVEAVMMTLPPLELDPPKKPPLKKPPPKPKPAPPLPPTTTRPLLPPELAIPISATGTGAGTKGIGCGVMVRVTVRVPTVAPAPRVRPVAMQAVRLTVRRTTRRCVVARLTCVVRAFVCLTIAGRGGGFSATWTAPPPMIAPPQAQAQSFAKAILTDISAPFSWPVQGPEEDRSISGGQPGY